MTDFAFAAFRDFLRQERTAEEIAAALIRAVERELRPAFVQLRLDHGIGAASAIPPEDPLVGHALRHAGSVAVAAVDVASPVLDEWRVIGAELVVPLVSQGTLVGVMVLGPGGAAGGYGEDHWRWLEDLAAFGAAALRVAWLTHQHEVSE